MNPVAELKKQAENVTEEIEHEARPWIIGMARFGYVAKGVIYIVIGLLAFQAALGQRDAQDDAKDALAQIAIQPLGRILLGALTVGLFGYVLWKVVEAVFDPERKGNSLRGLFKRGAYLISAIVYTGMAVTSFQVFAGIGGWQEEVGPDFWTARFLVQPFGRWLVVLAGLVVIGAGLFQFYLVITANFKGPLKSHRMNALENLWALTTGRVGLTARGVILVTIGWFLVQAALEFDPDQAGGTKEALAALANTRFGPWILGAVAIGLVSYGIYTAFLSRFRQIYGE